MRIDVRIKSDARIYFGAAHAEAGEQSECVAFWNVRSSLVGAVQERVVPGQTLREPEPPGPGNRVHPLGELGDHLPALLMRRTIRSSRLLLLASHSHTTIRRQPSSWSRRAERLSRSTFSLNFFFQNLRFDEGVYANSQPS